MTTAFVGVASSSPLGDRAFYRITFEDAPGVGFKLGASGLYVGFANVFSEFYESMASRSGVVYPLSPNPVTPGAKVAVVDCQVSHGAGSVSAAEAVRRLEMASGGTIRVRVLQKLDNVQQVQQGANNRQQMTEHAAQQRAAESPIAQLANTVGGVAQYLLFGVAAFAAIRFSKDLK